MDNSNNSNNPNSPGNTPSDFPNPWGTANPLSSTSPIPATNPLPEPASTTPPPGNPSSNAYPSPAPTADTPWNPNPYPTPISNYPNPDLNQSAPTNPFIQAAPNFNQPANPFETNPLPQSTSPSPWPPAAPSPVSEPAQQSSWTPTPQADPMTNPMSQSSIPTASTMPADHPAFSDTPQTPMPQNPTTPTTPNLSPLDNPWGAPAALQTPTADSAVVNNPLSTENPTPSQTPVFPPPTSTDASAPTDLSHLITGNNNNHDENTIKNEGNETLIVPSTITPDIPTVPNENKGIPKWLIGVGIGLLILVAGASAYFILGIGKAPETPTSVPAQITQEVKPPATPIPTPIPQESPVATGSTNFGQLEGSGTTQNQATSAADLIRQRQQAR